MRCGAELELVKTLLILTGPHSSVHLTSAPEIGPRL